MLNEWTYRPADGDDYDYDANGVAYLTIVYDRENFHPQMGDTIFYYTESTEPSMSFQVTEVEYALTRSINKAIVHAECHPKPPSLGELTQTVYGAFRIMKETDVHN